jgi:potassium-transporting ATPase KdpC subunit
MSILNPAIRPAARQYVAAVRALVVLTVLLGLAYPLLLTGIGAVAFHHRADGSMLTMQGRTVGSSLIGQSFTDAKGNPLPQWFQSRPSAAGDGYDPSSSSASNLGPDNPDLVADITARRAAIAAFDGVAPSAVPPDAVTASGSGLDPDISPAYARIQVARVARARHLPVATVAGLVTRTEHGRTLGFLGEPVVNVVELNAALARLAG